MRALIGAFETMDLSHDAILAEVLSGAPVLEPSVTRRVQSRKKGMGCGLSSLVWDVEYENLQ